MSPNVVSGTISTVSELGKDEAWLHGWLREQPTRLGLGELSTVADDGEAEADGTATPGFVATSEERQFSVDVQLGEIDAMHGFGMLDAWARSRARHPGKEHVAVLVTETTGERYRPTLEALSQHLPLVVVELQVWRGENEALVVPHVALCSPTVDLGSAPALSAARAVSALTAAQAVASEAASPDPAQATGATPEATAATADDEPGDVEPAEAEAEEADDEAVDKDDTGVRDPWGLPRRDPEPATSTSNGSRLLSRFNG